MTPIVTAERPLVYVAQANPGKWIQADDTTSGLAGRTVLALWALVPNPAWPKSELSDGIWVDLCVYLPLKSEKRKAPRYLLSCEASQPDTWRKQKNFRKVFETFAEAAAAAEAWLPGAEAWVAAAEKLPPAQASLFPTT